MQWQHNAQLDSISTVKCCDYVTFKRQTHGKTVKCLLRLGICVAWTIIFVVSAAYFSDPQLQLLSQQAIMQTI